MSGQLTHASPHTPLAHRTALLTQYRGVHARTWVQLEAENMHHASRGCTTNPRTASVTRQAWSALVALEQKAAVPLLVEDRYNFSCVVSASKPLHVRRLHPIGAIELHKGSRRLRKGPRYIEQQFEPPLNRMQCEAPERSRCPRSGNETDWPALLCRWNRTQPAAPSFASQRSRMPCTRGH